MKTKRRLYSVWSMALSLGVSIALGPNLQGAIAYNLSAPLTGNQTIADPGFGNAVAFGLQFTVGSTPITVTDLGAFDSAQDGYSFAVNIELYGANHTTPLVSMVFSPTQPGTLDAGSAYRFKSLGTSSVLLDAGSTYTIVGRYYGTVSPYESSYDAGTGPSLIQTDSGITHVASYHSLNYSSFPDQQDFGAQPQFGAGTFKFELTPVPEPEHFAVAGLGLLGLVYVGRNLWLRRKVAA